MEESFGRILGIDYGDSRIGLSISDPLRIIAQALTTLSNTDSLFSEIQQVITHQQVKKIVIGNPLTLNGEHKESSEKVQQFAIRLKEIFDGEIIFVDERLTSVQAHHILRQTTHKKKRRDKTLVDKLAAVFILQSYLDREQFKKKYELR